ncbi:MAG: chemotaxis protein CheW [Pseudomonadota bacterium]|nr:chemotaxis protein CheW [Pseudomonadota bacterium]
MSELYLIAHIADRAVAIAAAQVESVVDIGDIVPVPGACRQVRGLAALRSRVVTVIDTRVALGLAPVERDDGLRAVITRHEGHHYAILADTLEDVAPFVATPLPNGVTLEAGWRAAGSCMVERDGEPTLVIDLRTLIPALAAPA